MERWPERGACCPHQIIAWFESWPDKNVGVLTGEGLVVVDVDPKNGGRQSFRKLTKGRKWPTTATASTGPGGDDFLFRVDPPIPIGNANGLMPGDSLRPFRLTVTGEKRVKKSKKGLREYIYYRGSRYNAEGHPRHRPTESDCDEPILDLFDRMRLDDEEVRDRFLTVLRARTRDQRRTSQARLQELDRQIAQITAQQDRLLNLRLNDEIEADIYGRKASQLRDREAKLRLCDGRRENVARAGRKT